VEARLGWDRTWNKDAAGGDKPAADAAGDFGWDKEWRVRERRERLERRQKVMGAAAEAGSQPVESLASAPQEEAAPKFVERPAEPVLTEKIAERPVVEAPKMEAPAARPAPRPAAKPQPAVERLPEEKFNW
jgi:hypothetical protein